jgi:hypothetical protein
VAIQETGSAKLRVVHRKCNQGDGEVKDIGMGAFLFIVQLCGVWSTYILFQEMANSTGVFAFVLGLAAIVVLLLFVFFCWLIGGIFNEYGEDKK